MKTIRAAIEIAQAQEVVFDLTQNYAQRLDWDPYLSEAYLMKNATEPAVGVDAYCKNRNGSVMVSRYISFNRPSVAAVSMVKGPKILKRFNGAWNVHKIDAQHAELIFTYHFELRWGLFGKLLTPWVRWHFAREMNKRLVAIKAYLEA